MNNQSVRGPYFAVLYLSAFALHHASVRGSFFQRARNTLTISSTSRDGSASNKSYASVESTVMNSWIGGLYTRGSKSNLLISAHAWCTSPVSDTRTEYILSTCWVNSVFAINGPAADQFPTVNDGRRSVSEKSVHGVSFEKWDNRFLFITRTDLRKTIINLRNVSNRFNDGENKFKFLSKPSIVVIIFVIVIILLFITNIVVLFIRYKLSQHHIRYILIGTDFVHK